MVRITIRFGIASLAKDSRAHYRKQARASGQLSSCLAGVESIGIVAIVRQESNKPQAVPR